jgi:predicted 3-demethylubiquinone-9 3-methyltransferase (glyoxalase superfamily)
MPNVRHIRPCLWFDNQAEEAAKYYISIFPRSKIVQIARYNDVGVEIHGRQPGSVMTVTFELAGHPFMALNGGPIFKFNEAISLEVECETQEELDYFWEKLSAGGDPQAQQCGWLKDKYGLSWQVTPSGMEKYFADHTSTTSKRAMAAMLEMKKLDIAQLEKAIAG